MPNKETTHSKIHDLINQFLVDNNIIETDIDTTELKNKISDHISKVKRTKRFRTIILILLITGLVISITGLILFILL